MNKNMNNNMKKNHKRIKRSQLRRIINGLYTVLTISLILISVLSVKGTAYSMEKQGGYDRAMEGYYRTLESEYLSKVKDILSAEGYTNSGVMMTKIIEEGNVRSYTLTIHHRRLGTDEATDSLLVSKINSLGVPVDGSSICVMTTN